MNNMLYKITSEYQIAFDDLSEKGFDRETIEDSLSLIKDDVEEKAINVASYIKNIDADIESIKNAELEMKNRRIKMQKESESIRDHLLSNMIKCGINEINHSHFGIKLKKKPRSVIIDDKKEIPDSFIRRREIVEPNKILIKESLNLGVNISGCHLSENNYRLEIK